jgi:hypothetical protein
VEEKLLVNYYDKRLNVSGRAKSPRYRCSLHCWRGAKVCRLANLASSLILSFGVRVEEDLGNEENERNCDRKRQHPDQAMSRVALANHHSPWTILAFSFDARVVP